MGSLLGVSQGSNHNIGQASFYLELGVLFQAHVKVSRIQLLLVVGPRSHLLGGCQLGLLSAPYHVALSQVL